MNRTELLAKLLAGHPSGAHDDLDEVHAAWRALDPADRRKAVDRLDAWLAHKPAGRKVIIGVPKYLRQRAWQRLEPVGGKPEVERAAAFSRAWWWLFHAHVVASMPAIRDRDSAPAQFLRHRGDMASKYAIGWEIAPPDKLATIEAAAQALASRPADSPEVRALGRRYREDYGVDMPLPDKDGVWVFIPPDAAELSGQLASEAAP